MPNALFFKSRKTGSYCEEMDGAKFAKWFKEQFIHNIPANSVIVTDSTICHCIQVDRAPMNANKKQDMINWIVRHGVVGRPYNEQEETSQTYSLQ